jgi:hypothetical protein
MLKHSAHRALSDALRFHQAAESRPAEMSVF